MRDARNPPHWLPFLAAASHLACLVQPLTNFRMHKVADTAPLLHDTATAIIDCFN